MKESKVESALRQAADAAGGWAPKWVSPGNAGIPDRLVIVPHAPCPVCGAASKVAAVEVKAPGQRPRPLQLQQLARLRQLGMPAVVVDTPELARAFVLALSPGLARTASARLQRVG